MDYNIDKSNNTIFNYCSEKKNIKETEKKKVVFISGPMTGVPDYKEKFEAAEALLHENGYDLVINPSKINNSIPEGALEYNQCLQADLLYLSFCTHIHMLEGWENSKGATAELRYALNNNISIVRL